MGSIGAEYERCAGARFGCTTDFEIDGPKKSATATNRGRDSSGENCTVNFPVSAATHSGLGFETILPNMTASPVVPQQPAIKEAVILMAGSGSRLRINNSTLLKPLVPIHGRPLVSYTINTLVASGVEKIIAVVGFERELLVPKIRTLIPATVAIDFVTNSDWQKQNGVSVLAAADHVTGPFLLTMSDHLFDPEIIALLLRESDRNKVNIAVDTKLNSIFDLPDAMKLQTENGRAIAIGKDLSKFNAIDTGLFVCSTELFDYLRRASQVGDCSLADGIRLMTADDKVNTVNIGPAWWQDVDTPEMLAEAQIRTQSWQHRPDLARATH
jgi:choline kinase